MEKENARRAGRLGVAAPGPGRWGLVLPLMLIGLNDLALLAVARALPAREPTLDVLLIIVSLSAFWALLTGWRHRVRQKPDEAPRTGRKMERSAVSGKRDESADMSLLSDIDIIDFLPDVLAVKDGENRLLAASPAYLALYSLRGRDYRGKDCGELFDGRPEARALFRRHSLLEERAWQQRGVLSAVETHAGNGGRRKFEVIRAPIFDASGGRKMMIVRAFDVTLRENKESQLQLIASAFHSNTHGIMLLDRGLGIIRVNASFTALTGFTGETIQRKGLTAVLGDDYRTEFLQTMRTYLESHGEWRGEVGLCRASGESFATCLSIVRVTGANGTITHYLAMLSDISEKKAAEERIIHLAHHDELTGMPNRAMFSDRLNQVMTGSMRRGLINVLLFVDLDRFKAVNDSLGHRGGDEVLCEAANRLTSILPGEGLLARLGSDEFAMLLKNQKSVERASYSASLSAQKIISQLSLPFYVRGQEVFVGASVGIAISPQDGTDADDLLKHAASAMHHAKRQGRNKYQFFRKELAAASRERIRLERQLRGALENHDLRLYYQPQYDAGTRTLCGAEVLVRWQDPRAGLILPAKFIPIAEESGLIIPIGVWILEQACRKLKTWRDAGYPLERISVNVSARQFSEPVFVQTVEDVLVRVGLDARHLELEITESVLVEDVGRAELMLSRLRRMGAGLAIDDFGTGYSSLAYLKRFPIHVLKIDRSFVKDVTSRQSDAAICRSIIAMAHNLGQRVVAEGVETAEQLEFLTRQKCDFVQGFLLCAPLPEHDMEALLRRLHEERTSPP